MSTPSHGEIKNIVQ